MRSTDRISRAERHQLQQPPVRFWPVAGRQLSLANVRGPWRPSGAVAGAGLFAIVWSTRGGSFWAPLHDFELAAQQQLIAACRHEDQRAGYPGAWPQGRGD